LLFSGGGAIELEISKHLRQYARQVEGKIQLVINSFAKALETIPRNISDNAGLDSVEVLNKLRQKHAQGGGNFLFEIPG
jgi:T-complex protein 1 subunit eta